MQRYTVRPEAGFHVLGGTQRSQAAVMVLGPGERTGGPDNRHPGSDQWLYVIGGRGHAVVGGEPVDLDPGTLLLIAADETHQVEAAGDTPLETVNIYAPPAY